MSLLLGRLVPVFRVSTNGWLKLVSPPLISGQKLTDGSPGETGGEAGIRQLVPVVLLIRSATHTVLAEVPHGCSVIFSLATADLTPAQNPDWLPNGAQLNSITANSG